MFETRIDEEKVESYSVTRAEVGDEVIGGGRMTPYRYILSNATISLAFISVPRR